MLSAVARFVPLSSRVATQFRQFRNRPQRLARVGSSLQRAPPWERIGVAWRSQHPKRLTSECACRVEYPIGPQIRIRGVHEAAAAVLTTVTVINPAIAA